VTTSPEANSKKATITLDAANSDRQFPAYQLSINAMTSETSGHGYRLMGPKYVGRSRNLRTVELTQRDADEIRAILDEAFPPPADQAAVLTAPERQFLTFALDLAFDRMVSDDGFTDEDEAALEKLRRMASGEQS